MTWISRFTTLIAVDLCLSDIAQTLGDSRLTDRFWPTAADSANTKRVSAPFPNAMSKPLKLRKTPRECSVPDLQAVDLGITVPRVTVVATEDDASISYKLPGGPAKDFTRLKMTQP